MPKAVSILFFLFFGRQLSGQGIENIGDTVFIHFDPISTKIKSSSKQRLDSIAHLLTTNQSLGVQILSSTKDFCSKCGARAWDRTMEVWKYLKRKGGNTEQFCSLSLHNGEFDRIAVVVGTWVAPGVIQPHPNLRKRAGYDYK